MSMEGEDQAEESQTLVDDAREEVQSGAEGEANEVTQSNGMDLDTLANVDETTTLMKYTPVFTLQGHKRSVSSLSISPDGQQLVSGGSDGLLKLWSLASGALIVTLDAALDVTQEQEDPAHLRLGISDVAWSKDGSYIVCGGDDCVVRVWNAITVSIYKHPLRNTRLNLYPFIISS